MTYRGGVNYRYRILDAVGILASDCHLILLTLYFQGQRHSLASESDDGVGDRYPHRGIDLGGIGIQWR